MSEITSEHLEWAAKQQQEVASLQKHIALYEKAIAYADQRGDHEIAEELRFTLEGSENAYRAELKKAQHRLRRAEILAAVAQEEAV